MTREELCKFCNISIKKLETYEKAGFISATKTKYGEYDYCDRHVEQLGLIDTLLKVDFTQAEIKKYLSCCNHPEQIKMLRDKRRNLLDVIHVQQKLLDSIDFIIWSKKKLK